MDLKNCKRHNRKKQIEHGRYLWGTVLLFIPYLLISKIWYFDIKISSFWYQKIFLDIKNYFLISKHQIFIKKSSYYYILMWNNRILDITNLIFYIKYQIIDKKSKSWYIKEILFSDIKKLFFDVKKLNSLYKKSNSWYKNMADFLYKKIILLYQKLDQFIIIPRIRFFNIKNSIYWYQNLDFLKFLLINCWYQEIFFYIKRWFLDIKKSNFWYKNMEWIVKRFTIYSALLDIKNRLFDIKQSISLYKKSTFLSPPPDRMIGAYCFSPVCLFVCLSVYCQL